MITVIPCKKKNIAITVRTPNLSDRTGTNILEGILIIAITVKIVAAETGDKPSLTAIGIR